MKTTKCLLEHSEYWVASFSIRAPYTDFDFTNAKEQCPDLIESMQETNANLVEIPDAMIEAAEKAYDAWRACVAAIYSHVGKSAK